MRSFHTSQQLQHGSPYGRKVAVYGNNRGISEDSTFPLALSRYPSFGFSRHSSVQPFPPPLPSPRPPPWRQDLGNPVSPSRRRRVRNHQRTSCGTRRETRICAELTAGEHFLSVVYALFLACVVCSLQHVRWTLHTQQPWRGHRIQSSPPSPTRFPYPRANHRRRIRLTRPLRSIRYRQTRVNGARTCLRMLPSQTTTYIIPSPIRPNTFVTMVTPFRKEVSQMLGV